MNPLGQIAVLLIGTAFSIYIILVWLRFLLQLVHADFYNPISQFVVKATSPLLHPLRRIIPAWGGMDMAALLLIVLLQMVETTLLSLLLSGGTVPPITLLISTVFSLLLLAAKFYFWLLILSVVLSWVAPGSYSPGVVLVQQLTEPLLAPCRKLLPNMGGLDISPIIAFLGIKIFEILVQYSYAQVMPLLS